VHFDFSFSRNNHTFWGGWLWTIDIVLLFIAFFFMALGTLLVAAASPAVAHHYGYEAFFFLKKHVIYTSVALCLMIIVSHLSFLSLRRLAFGLFFLLILALWATVLWGETVKGARRWLSFFSLKLQPSDLLRPCFILLVAWFLSEEKRLQNHFKGTRYSVIAFVCIAIPLLLQPDMGMLVLTSLIFMVQLFLGGLSWFIISLTGGAALLFGIFAFCFFPHVRHRIQIFIDPSFGNKYGDQFQIFQSLEALKKGGWFGSGLGEGVIKNNLPDAHTDFILAVLGEEMGLVFCIVLLGLYGFVVLRVVLKSYLSNDSFTFFAIAGLGLSLGFQVLINTASILGVIPTKGMPLPFLSYGGSSMLSTSLTMGFLLALTRKRMFPEHHYM